MRDLQGFAVDAGAELQTRPEVTFLENSTFLVLYEAYERGIERVSGRTVDILDRIELRSGRAVLNWIAVPGKKYLVQYKSKLSDSSWTNLGNELTAASAILTTVDENLSGVSERFYRILELP